MIREDIHGASRNDGRDGVLVDHLGYRVLQQDDILVERLDLTLQLDPVHKINRNRHVLAPQGVKKGILKELPLVAHGRTSLVLV